jgi:serralysin
MGKLRFAAVLAAAASLLALVVTAEAGPGFKTAKPAYVEPVAPGVVVDPILSTGDTIGDYQMSGIPDGLGAYLGGNETFGHDEGDDGEQGNGTATVVMNHELSRLFNGALTNPGVDARISRLVIDRDTHAVLDAEYLFTGLEGFERFCSATLALIDGRPLYFTGEETGSTGHDGSSIVMDPETGAWRETAHFGKAMHENVVPLKLSKWMFLTTDDDFRAGQPAYLYAWIAKNVNKAIRGRDGGLYVWKADNPAKTGNASVAKNESVPGHFVGPFTAAERATSVSLKAAATARGAFKFDRLEDLAVRRDIRGRTYFADTGKPPATLAGRVYQFDIDPRDPTRATAKMILNGDAPDNDDIRNPDNMDASSKVLVIQEDREAVFRGEPNRILVYDFKTKTVTTVAKVHTPDLVTPPYNQESSGVIDAGRLLGANWWLVDVQAHNRTANQPGPTLVPDSSTGEAGQLLAIYIPNSTGGGNDDDE